MIDHILVTLFYALALATLILCTKAGRTDKNILFCFLFMFVYKVLFALIIYDNNLAVLSGKFSMYDAADYYVDTLTLLESGVTLFPDLPLLAADPGYNTLLYWIGLLYTKILNINNIDYLFFLYFNVFVGTISFLFIAVYFKEKKWLKSKQIVTAAIVIGFFEPSMLAFGSVLEREVLIGLLVLLTFISLIESHWVRFFCFLFLLIMIRSAYLFVIPTTIIAWGAYNIFPFFRRHFNIYLVSLLLIFTMAVHVASVMSDQAAYLFFRHTLSDVNLSGLGGYIAALPYGIMVTIYSLLGFFSPIPLYPFFDDRIHGFYLFGLLQGLGSVFYLCCHMIIIMTILRLRRIVFSNTGSLLSVLKMRANYQYKIVTQGYLAVFILHIVFQGFAYNIRHKVQIVPLLIFLALYCMQSLNLKSSIMTFFRLKQFAQSFCIIVLLNVIYFAVKL